HVDYAAWRLRPRLDTNEVDRSGVAKRAERSVTRRGRLAPIDADVDALGRQASDRRRHGHGRHDFPAVEQDAAGSLPLPERRELEYDFLCSCPHGYGGNLQW